ncbi:MAG: Flp pilus assembly protein CpaB [Solirubrobacteraceae bacterium]
MSSWPRLRSRERGPSAADLTDADAPRLRPRETGAPAAEALSQLRRLREPLPLIGIALVLIAFVGYLAVYSSTTHRTPVLVTTRALPAGTVLRASDLRAAELAGDSSVIAGLEPESDLRQVIGQRLQTALPAGTPLPMTALAAPAPATSAMTLAIPAVHALAGALQPGDRVTVLATFGAGTGQARSLPIARGVQVLDVDATPASADQASATVPITLALPDPSIASKLALAANDGKLDLLREGKGAATAPIPPARNADRP